MATVKKASLQFLPQAACGDGDSDAPDTATESSTTADTTPLAARAFSAATKEAGQARLSLNTRQDRLNLVNILASLVLRANLPYRICEEPAFLEFCQQLAQNPEMRLPARWTVTQHATEIYEQFIKESTARFKELMAPRYKIPGKVAVTMDCWTADNGEGFLVVTFHFITDAGLESMIAACEPFPAPHTTVALLAKLVEIAERYGFPVNRAGALEELLSWAIVITVDNAANISKVAEQAEAPWLRLPCACHTVQLPLRDVSKPGVAADPAKNIAAKSPGPLAALIQPIHDLIVLFSNSTKRREALATAFKRLYPGERLLRLCFPCATRWNTQYLMVIRYCQLFHPLAALPWELLYGTQDEHTAAFAELKRVNVELPDVLRVLEPFYMWTNRLSASKKVTISLIPRAVTELLDATKPNPAYSVNVKAIASGLHDSLKRRFDGLLRTDTTQPGVRAIYLGAFFDPRSVKAHISRGADGKFSKETSRYALVIKEALEQDLPLNAVDTDDEEDVADDDGLPKGKKPKKASFGDTLQTEVSTYLADANKDAVDDPLHEWWLTDSVQAKYPILYWFARHYLAQQASEAASERGASLGGLVYRARRQRLAAQRACSAVVLSAASRTSTSHAERYLPHSERYTAAYAIQRLQNPPAQAAAEEDSGSNSDGAAADAEMDIIDLDNPSLELAAEDDDVNDDVVSLDEGDMDNALLDGGIALDADGNLDTLAAVEELLAGEDNCAVDNESEAVESELATAQSQIAGLRRSNRIAKVARRLKKYVEYDYD